MPRFKRRGPTTFTAVYYDSKGRVVLSETLRALNMDDALYQASKSSVPGAARHRVFNEELEALQGAADMSEAIRRHIRNGGPVAAPVEY